MKLLFAGYSGYSSLVNTSALRSAPVMQLLKSSGIKKASGHLRSEAQLWKGAFIGFRKSGTIRNLSACPAFLTETWRERTLPRQLFSAMDLNLATFGGTKREQNEISADY